MELKMEKIIKTIDSQNRQSSWRFLVTLLKRFKAVIGQTNLLILGVFLGIALVIPEYFIKSLAFTGTSLVSIAPFILISVGIAAYLKAAGADKIIARVFSGRAVTVIIFASVFGALSPFCSCGVIPLIAALLASGVPLSAVMAFWLASPVMSPDMFVLTAAELGLEFAVAKTLATIGIGLLGGFTTLIFQRAGFFINPLKTAQTSSCGCDSKPVVEGSARWRFWQEAERIPMFRQEFVHTSIFLVQWLVFAFALESLMVEYLPPETISSLLDPGSAFIIPIAALVGVPAYLNGYAAIPVASGLLNSGFGVGAVLSFMTAGAMTSIPAAIAVFSIVRRPVFYLYIALSLGGAMVMGFGYQIFSLI